MVMEDNTYYLARRTWWKILPPVLVGDLLVLLMTYIWFFFLIGNFCSKESLVIYSAFLPFCLFAALTDALFSFAGPQIFSRYKGASNHVHAQEVFQETLTVMLVLLVIILGVTFVRMHGIVRFLNISEELVPEAIVFGRWFFLCLALDTLTNAFKNFLRGDSLPKEAMLFSLMGNTTYFIASCIFFIVFKSRISTLPIILCCCACLAFVGYSSLFWRKKTTVQFRFRWMRWSTFVELFSVSSGNILSCFMSFIVGILAVRYVFAAYGGAAVTILAMSNLLLNVAASFSRSFVFSMQALGSIYYGEKNGKGVSIVFRKGLVDGLILQLGLLLLGVLTASSIAVLFRVQENYVGEGGTAVCMCMLAFPLQYLSRYLSGFYNVTGHGSMIFICTVVSDAICYPLVIMFFLFVVKNEHYFWWYLPVSWLLCALTAWFAAIIRKHRKKYDNLLLIKRADAEYPAYYFLLNRSQKEFRDYSIMLNAFLAKHSVDTHHIARVKHLFEELYLFACDNIPDNSKALFSVVTTLHEHKIEIALRYDSKESCLDSALNGHQSNLSPELLAGAKLMLQLSDNIYVDKVYGYNYIRLTLRHEKV